MKQTLQLRLSQHLALTPQLQQSIRLLQLSTLELNQEIEKFLSDNPLMERDDLEPESTSSYLAAQAGGSLPSSPTEPQRELPAEQQDSAGSADDSAIDWYAEGRSTPSGPRSDDDDTDYQDIQAAGTTLRDHLISQLALTQISDRDRSLTRFLIEAIDDDGYLTQSLEDLLPLLPQEYEVEQDDLLIALRHVQSMDPPGVGARSAAECLALQLVNMEPTPDRDLALTIVRQHLELLAARDYAKLKKALGCGDDELRGAHQLICSLNPRPGAQFSAIDTRYIVPDVIVKKTRNQWQTTLNPDAMPKLRINRLYADILQQQRSNGAASGLSSQLQEAKWFIKNVQQRFDTILRVSQAIVNRQRQFFDYGEVAMRPLTLREIAEELGLHESTISRVTTQKFMATPRGIFELKYFFGSHVSTVAGGECSATAIRALIRQLVGAEDSKRPLSDAKIAEILGQQGIVVARRTIAKYREALNIPPVNLRKSI